jgi:hypothetical protein
VEREKVTNVKPELQAMLIADHVYKDVATQKHIICGVFTVLFLRSPIKSNEKVSAGSRHQAGFASGTPFAYLSFRDIVGNQKFEGRYVRLADDVVLFQFDLQATGGVDRLNSAEVIVPLPQLPNEPGVYALELLWKGSEPLGSYRITVIDERNEATK